MKKYIILFLIGCFLGFLEDQRKQLNETQKSAIKNQIEENTGDYLFIHPFEELPKFKYGGNQGLLKTIFTKLVYPKEGCSGSTVVISFIVNKKGLVEQPIIEKSICSQIDEQLLQIISKLEFEPGKIDGEITSMELNLPIRICLR